MSISNENIKIVNTLWMISGTNCWVAIQQNQDYNFIKGVILNLNGNRQKARISYFDQKGPEEVPVKDIFEANPEVYQEGWNDMVQMNILNEPEIIANIKQRYLRDIIFTFIGPTLIVINPYKTIIGLFEELKIDNKPHIYSIADNALSNFQQLNKNQAIVISGESGAGKTENAKYAMKFITSLNSSKGMEDQILSCNPLLEAFGNAKTVRNDNSSRFGKYVRIYIENKQIKGAEIRNYLLEKSRVTDVNPGERNYHIFYLFLSGYQQLNQFHIDSNSKFNYLTDKINLPGWDEIELSFSTMNFYENEIQAILVILASILHIGNIQFDDNSNAFNLDKPSKTLQVSEEALKKALVVKRREVGDQVIESPQPLSECKAMQSSLSRALYDKLFNWLVLKLNQTLSSQSHNKNDLIGLLDIFGFENFQNNSFEQMCINFTNEKLQQLYISYIFKAEEEEFKKEGLGEYLGSLKYQDNTPILDLMDKQHQGIFDLIDESCQLGSGTEEQLMQKIAKAHQDNAYFKIAQGIQQKFSIVHTAQIVEYNIQGFRTKNKDEISKDLDRCIQESSNDILKQIWNGKESNKKESKFLGGKFRKQMKELMDELQSCDVHFVRCIKPNEEKKADYFLNSYVLQQVRYLGVLESVKIRKEGYPIRLEYPVFYSRYYELDPMNRRFTLERHEKMGSDMKGLVKEMISRLFPKLDKKVLIYGNSRAYLKMDIANDLDKLLSKWQIYKKEKAIKIQKTYRRYRSIKRMKQINEFIKKLSKAATKLKKSWKEKRIRQKQRIAQGLNKLNSILTQRAIKKWKRDNNTLHFTDEMQYDMSNLNQYDDYLNGDYSEYNPQFEDLGEDFNYEYMIDPENYLERQKQLQEEEEEINRKIQQEEEQEIQRLQQIEQEQKLENEKKQALMESQMYRIPFKGNGLPLWSQSNVGKIRSFHEQQNYDSQYLKPIVLEIEEYPQLLSRINNNIQKDSRLFYASANYNLIHYWDTTNHKSQLLTNSIHINQNQNEQLKFSKHERKFIDVNILSLRLARLNKQIENAFHDYTQEFMETVNMSSFLDYCEKYVHRGKNWMSRALPMKTIMMFQSYPLREALTFQFQNNSAVLAFRSILKFCNIRKSRFASEYHYNKIILLMHVNEPPRLNLDQEFLKQNRNQFTQIVRRYLFSNQDINKKNDKERLIQLLAQENEETENMNNILEQKRQGLLSTKQTRIREELYLQLCKLINGCPQEYLEKLFQLLYIFCNSYLPGIQMILPLLNYLKDFIQREHNSIIKVYAKLCFDTLAKQYQAIIICQKAYEIQLLQPDSPSQSYSYYTIHSKFNENFQLILDQIKIYNYDPIEERLWMLQEKIESIVSFAHWILPRIESRIMPPSLKLFPLPKNLNNQQDQEQVQPIVKIHLHSEESISVPIEMYYTTRLVVLQACKILELEPIQQLFGLQIILRKDLDIIDEGFAEDNDKIVDYIQKFEKIEAPVNDFAHFKISMKFYLKIKIVYPLIKNDLITLKFYVSQNILQFKQYKIKKPLKETMKLAALLLYMQYGKYQNDQNPISIQTLTQNIKTYFNFKLAEQFKETTGFSPLDWAEIIFKDYKLLNIMNFGLSDKYNTQMTFLNMLRSSVEFLAHQFPCKMQLLKSQDQGYKNICTQDIQFIIRPLQIGFLDQDYKIIKIIDIINISQWGLGPMGLFIRCDGDELYFLTDFPRIKVADIILNDYINWHINKIMVFRNCPEYTEKIMWNDLRENQQKMLAVEQGDYLQQNYGIDLKKSNKTSKYASNKGKKQEQKDVNMSKSFKNNEKSTIFDGKSYMVENKQEDYLIAENQFDYGDQNVNEYLGEQNGEEDQQKDQFNYEELVVDEQKQNLYQF